MINFSKNATCPSSQRLLAFQNGECGRAEETESVRRHLADCEFCAAEVEFYARFPQAEEICSETAKIPPPLYQLAEALLSNKKRNFKLLNRLMSESESLTLEKA